MDNERTVASEGQLDGAGAATADGKTRDGGPPFAEAGSGATTLESDVGPEIYQELLGAFVSHLAWQTAELTSAAAAGNIPAARFVAHQIKGTATGFGAVHLDELAQRMLQLGPDDFELLRSLVEEAEQEVGKIQGG
jgi:HPt (histidine-containing phosphotransfer) domain-containing protein